MRGVDSNKQKDHCVNDLMINHQQMRLSAFNEYKAKEYLIFQCTADKANRHIGYSSPTTFRMVEFQLEDVFIVIFILNMVRKPNVVEFLILGPSMARMALSRMARQRMARSATTSTTPESRTDYSVECSFDPFPPPDSGNSELDGLCTDNTSPYAHTRTFFSRRLPHHWRHLLPHWRHWLESD